MSNVASSLSPGEIKAEAQTWIAARIIDEEFVRKVRSVLLRGPNVPVTEQQRTLMDELEKL